MPIQLKNVARVELPADESLKALILGMYSYTSRSGEVFYNYTYQDGVAYLPPNVEKLKIVGSLLGEEIVDLRNSGAEIKEPFVLNPHFKLRDYQVEPTAELLKFVKEKYFSTLEAGCGTGKTIVMSYVAGQLNSKILILIDQSNLVENWSIAFDLIYNKKVQQLKSGNTEFGDVCIATFQLLNKNPELLARIKREFGALVCDEAHVVKAATFKYVLSRLDTKYRISCSATFFSKNLPIDILEDWLAPVSVRMVDNEALIPEVRWIDTGVVWPSDEPMAYGAKTLPWLAMNARRNAVIFDVLKRCLSEKRRTLVICITVKQAQFLDALVNKLGARSVVYVGSTTHKTDLKVKRDMNSGLLDFIFTSNKCSKGWDADSLDCIVLGKPNNNLKDAQQLTGRVVRKCKDKPKPLVYDFADVGYLAELFVRNRKKFYKNLNYEQEE